MASVPRRAELFDAGPTLVPVPRSTLLTQGALWVPNQLCRELPRMGIAEEVSPLLERTEPIAKSARSLAADRPTAHRQFETLGVLRGLETPRNVLLIDDVVTRGSTLLGAASRLAQAYPGVAVRAFAAARTTSLPDQFQRTLDPVRGTITLRPDGQTIRVP